MTTTKAPRAAIYASAKVAEIKPKENQYGANSFRVGLVERFVKENTTTEGEGEAAKEVKPKKAEVDARKAELAAEYETKLQGDYEKYVDKASKDLQSAITGAMSSGMFMLLLGQKVDIRITPAQGQLFGPVFKALNPRGDVGQQVLAAASEPQAIDPDELDDEDQDFDDEPGDDE